MEENLDEKQENQQHREILSGGGWDSPRTDINRGLLLGAVALLIVAGIAFGYGYRQQIAAGHLTAQQTVAQTTIDQLQSQLNSVNTRLNDMVTAQQAAEQAAAQKKPHSAAGTPKQGSTVDKRYKLLQAQLEDQEKQLKEAQDLMAKNRTDLETGQAASWRKPCNAR